MSERDEIRRLIDVIEKGAGTASVEQSVEDLKLFANTASFLANKIDEGIPVVNITQCVGGQVELGKYYTSEKLEQIKAKVNNAIRNMTMHDRAQFINFAVENRYIGIV